MVINLKELALEFLNKIEDNGYNAYIVGGFVRDYLLGLESYDIDITTNATPKEIKKIFSNVYTIKNKHSDSNYGSVRVVYKNIFFEVTTFRIELGYLDNRHPTSIFYINDLETDLNRRDFTINAICMDKLGKIIDPLNGIKDLKKKTIKTINNSKKSFEEDALRILRAIRFSTVLNFQLDKEIIEAISITKNYLKNISYERKKIELDKIFASPYAKNGIELIKKLDLVDSLELSNLDRIKDYTDLIGIWAMINSNCYKFTKHEKELIKKVNLTYELNNLDPYVLYKYGLYVNILAGINKKISMKKITEEFNKLPIKSKKDIDINAKEICEILNKEPDEFLNNIYISIEKEILNKKLKNNKIEIIKYIKKNYL